MGPQVKLIIHMSAPELVERMRVDLEDTAIPEGSSMDRIYRFLGQRDLVFALADLIKAELEGKVTQAQLDEIGREDASYDI